MTLDWNWFFSSLSQSAAAIVGIFGAFIITKIFSNQTVFTEKRNILKHLLIQAKKISETANSYNIKWYNDHYNKMEFRAFHEHLDKLIDTGETIHAVTDTFLDNYIIENKFSKYSEKEDLKKELQFIATSVFEEHDRELERLRAADRAQAEIQKGGLGALAGMSAFMHNMTNLTHQNPTKSLFGNYDIIGTTPWEMVHKLRNDLEASYREAKHHTRLTSNFLESIEGNPESPNQISYALVLVLIIFFIGVIYPLSFMPAGAPPVLDFSASTAIEALLSFKGFLLTAISLAFTIIVAVFFTTNIRMKYPEKEIENLRKFKKTTTYCTYFKFMNDEDAVLD